MIDGLDTAAFNYGGMVKEVLGKSGMKEKIFKVFQRSILDWDEMVLRNEALPEQFENGVAMASFYAAEVAAREVLKMLLFERMQICSITGRM